MIKCIDNQAKRVEENLKIEYAEGFQYRYIGSLEEFIDLICKSTFTVKKNKF
ncbi:hypothetical protein KQH90_02750 [Anaerosalibacter bizertensis]|uniref:hypothetical protein n=1 Tax=Anaerosalibacter bizertensis TaxID=932217 RepID=UPI001C0F1704|nr:hypothetical protein [Anaerosalibacter bizertensis]MBU5292952.1 hypothetical protein [Anaerosalibacter bizertensis]